MLEILVAIVLIALNGVFSLSELAIVSARKGRLRSMAEAGRRGAATALALAEDPGRFLSTVQIGITLIGIVAGAFSGAGLGRDLAALFLAHGLAERVAGPLGYGLAIGVITYFSVVIGELVPKNLALHNAETIACATAPMMSIVSKVFGPVVWLLDSSTRLIFRLLGGATGPASAVTDEEIRTLVAEAQSAGVIEPDERAMISAVLRLGDRAVRAIMTPRTDTDWIDLNAPESEIRMRLETTQHARLPAGEGSPDAMVGVVAVREVLAPLLAGGRVDVRAHVRVAPVIPDTLDALDALGVLRKAEVPMALVHDEYGHFDGVVTPADILDAIAGAFRSDMGAEEPEALRRADGSWLLAGWMPADEMADLLGVALPERRGYETVAGLVIDALHHLPALGESVDAFGWRFEVVDLDGRRVDKVLAKRLGP